MKKIKEKNCFVKFRDSLCNKSKFIQKSQKGEGFAICTVCWRDFSVEHGGENNNNRHKDTSKHKRYVDAAQQQRKLTNFGAIPATERLFSGFLVEHNLPLRILHRVAELLRNMFPDSKIVSQCGLMKSTCMITKAVAMQINSDLKEELLLTHRYWSTADGSSDKDHKFSPVLVRQLDSFRTDSDIIAWYAKY